MVLNLSKDYIKIQRELQVGRLWYKSIDAFEVTSAFINNQLR